MERIVRKQAINSNQEAVPLPLPLLELLDSMIVIGHRGEKFPRLLNRVLMKFLELSQKEKREFVMCLFMIK